MDSRSITRSGNHLLDVGGLEVGGQEKDEVRMAPRLLAWENGQMVVPVAISRESGSR